MTSPLSPAGSSVLSSISAATGDAAAAAAGAAATGGDTAEVVLLGWISRSGDAVRLASCRARFESAAALVMPVTVGDAAATQGVSSALVILLSSDLLRLRALPVEKAAATTAAAVVAAGDEDDDDRNRKNPRCPAE